jgi:hypothetical protein
MLTCREGSICYLHVFLVVVLDDLEVLEATLLNLHAFILQASAELALLIVQGNRWCVTTEAVIETMDLSATVDTDRGNRLIWPGGRELGAVPNLRTDEKVVKKAN